MTPWTVEALKPGTFRPGARTTSLANIGDTQSIALIDDEGGGFMVWWKRDA